MEQIILATLNVSRELLNVVNLLAPEKDAGFLSISSERGVTHLGIKGISFSVFSGSGSRLCDVAIPQNYIISVAIADIRSFINDPKQEKSEDWISLVDIKFLPRLKMRTRKTSNKEQSKGNNSHE
jgi:hypothetical protein